MKKKLVSSVLALALCLGLTAPALAAEDGMANFLKSCTYTPGQFADVAATDWFAGSVQGAYELGLMKGQGAGFNPAGTLTKAEALALGARLHSRYHTGADAFQQGDPWYQVYADYAAANNIWADKGDLTAPITRGDFACIIHNAFPAKALAPINTVEDRAIPDVPSDSYLCAPVYVLYRAGVLTGNGDTRAFDPNSTIDRASVAAIVSRVADPSLRVNFTLNVQPVTLYAQWDRTIQVWPDEVSLYEGLGWSRTEPVATPRDTPIRILEQPTVAYHNSVGGISFYIQWNNHSDKPIKRAHFYVTPYDRVWDQMSCEVRGYSNADCYVTGPIYKVSENTDWTNDDCGDYGMLTSYQYSDGTIDSNRQTYKIYDDGSYATGSDTPNAYVRPSMYDNVFIRTYWENMWYNAEIDNLVITKVVIEYMDGSKTTLTGDALTNCIY